MVKRQLVRGNHQKIYFAEELGNFTSINRIKASLKEPKMVKVETVYQFVRSRIIAIESDIELSQEVAVDETDFKSDALFVLLDDMKVHYLFDEFGDGRFVEKRVIDLNGKSAEERVIKKLERLWSHVHITSRSITLDSKTFNFITNATGRTIDKNLKAKKLRFESA